MPDLLTTPLLGAAVAGCSTRRGGVSHGSQASLNLGYNTNDAVHVVRRNRERLQRQLPVRAVQYLTQVHGCDVYPAGEGTGGDPEADAMWTTARGVALAILTADCLPVLLADRHGQVIGAAHAGWRGLAGGVLDALLAAMPCEAHELVAWVGPAISAPSYEVDRPVLQAFSGPRWQNAPIATAFTPSRADHWWCDLPALASWQLREAGVGAVHLSNLCTARDQRFYSFRRDATTGRMASFVYLP